MENASCLLEHLGREVLLCIIERSCNLRIVGLDLIRCINSPALLERNEEMLTINVLYLLRGHRSAGARRTSYRRVVVSLSRGDVEGDSNVIRNTLSGKEQGKESRSASKRTHDRSFNSAHPPVRARCSMSVPVLWLWMLSLTVRCYLWGI
ncbi:hypothetical protein SISNIDRAFT_70906 [Sistotremastrum niveocremeum HHB9708]|uniref:Uncharacterized protein n=2 Tax=Sistotremastraceae TaxID=3402574 RepID=A0A164V6S2_9AGAM|nr:hypothetical protein SISNIDRAFT_70906 [Sistotremastrum niveocremeum HHB9708]KZT36435.1 hypothetical protein SISSUDRAFT_65998 [Sistotremastrum suecicum HHB10207 ss-3]